MTLNEVALNQRCRITGVVQQSEEIQSRLYALGLYPGIEVEILRYAPVGDPLQIRIGSTLLSVRKQEAGLIEVETDNG